MISFLKHIARKSKRLRELWRRARFLKEIVWHDAKNPRRALLFFKVLPYTMVSYERLVNAYALAQRTEEEKLQGAFMECGVWKGGAAAAMASAANSGRQIWLFDSFEGLPEPTLYDGARAKEYAGNKTSGTLDSIGKCVGPLEDVQRLFFRILRLPGDSIRIEQGWFQDLPQKSRLAPSHCFAWMPTGTNPLDAFWKTFLTAWFRAAMLSSTTTIVGRDAGKRWMNLCKAAD